MEKKLKRSRVNKVIGGVCGGIGEYFDIDPVFVRIVAVILAFGSGGIGIIPYIIAMIIMPKDEVEFHVNEQGETVQVEDAPRTYSSWNKYLPGLILVCIGVAWLIPEHFTLIVWDELLPLALILGGLFMIFRRKSKNKNKDGVEPTVEVHDNNHQQENGGSTI